MRIDQISGDGWERLAMLHRAAQVGRAVNGVTHDVNNHLGASLAYAELCALEDSMTADARKMLGDVVQGIKRASHLLGLLTDVARRDRNVVTLVSPEIMLRNLLTLSNYELKSARITVEPDIHSGTHVFPAHAPRITTAMLYLLQNAQENLVASSERRLRVGLRPVPDHDNATAAEFTFWDSGEPPQGEMRTAMFEPFTTNKEAPHLGLGLALARHIVEEQHQGTLRYEEGAGFVMTLPRVNGLEAL